MKQPALPIEQTILFIRGQKVILDRDLGVLYGVPTKVLNQSVKRNIKKFPLDFMFKINKEEKEQLVTNCDRFLPLKHSTVLPYAFTEHGAIMAASVLNSHLAIEVSIAVVRAFVKMRQLLIMNKEVSEKLKELEVRTDKNDSQIKVIFEAIRRLMIEESKPKEKIGFRAKQV